MVQKNPFKYLDAFCREEADHFHGRDQELRLLEERVRVPGASLLMGEVGVGKTSLIQAGLLPRLDKSGGFLTVYVHAGQQLRDRFFEALRAALDNNWNSWLDQAGVSSWKGLPEFFDAFTVENSRKVLLVFDDVDGMFATEKSEAELNDFFTKFLMPMQRPSRPLHSLLIFRSATVPLLARMGEIGSVLLGRSLFLPRLSGEAALAAVAEPLRRQGFDFEPELPQAICKDLGQWSAGAGYPADAPSPAELQVVCGKLVTLALEQKQRLTVSFFDKQGGAAGLVDTWLRRLVEDPPADREKRAEPLFSLFKDRNGRGRRLPRQILLWIFSQKGKDEEALERLLGWWCDRKALHYDPRDETFGLYHQVLAEDAKFDPGTGARLAALTRRLDRFAHGDDHPLSFSELEVCLRFRKVVPWNEDRLAAAFLSAVEREFPHEWWRTLMIRTKGEPGFREIAARLLLVTKRPKLQVGLLDLVAEFELESLDPDQAESLEKLALKLVGETRNHLNLRLAALSFCSRRHLVPPGPLVQQFLFREEWSELRSGFLTWASQVELINLDPFLKKWGVMEEGKDPDVNDPTYVDRLVALLSLSNEGFAALEKTVAQRFKPMSALHPNIITVLPLFVADVDRSALAQMLGHVWDACFLGEPDPDQLILQKRLLHFVREFAAFEVFPCLWERACRMIPLPEEVAQALGELFDPSHLPIMVDALEHPDELLRRNAKAVLVASGPSEQVGRELEALGDEYGWEVNAVVLRRLLQQTDSEELPEQYALPHQYRTTVDVLWAKEFLPAFFKLRPGSPDWLMLFQDFEENLDSYNQILLEKFELESQQEWAAALKTSGSLSRRQGLFEINKQRRLCFGEKALEELDGRLLGMNKALRDWLDEAGRIQGRLDETRAGALRLILKKLENLYKIIESKHNEFAEHCRRLSFDPITCRRLYGFVATELLGLWQTQAQTLQFLHQKLLEGGGKSINKDWNQAVKDFGLVVDRYLGDLQYWKDCLPRIKDREILESLHLNHRTFLEVRMLLLEALARMGGNQEWVKETLLDWFGKPRTEFGVNEWRLIVHGLSAFADESVGLALSIALKTHRGLEPEIIQALQKTNRLDLVGERQIKTILSHPKPEVRAAVLRIFAETKPEWVRDEMDKVLQWEDRESSLIVFQVLTDIGDIADIQALLQYRRLLNDDMWGEVKDCIGKIVERVVIRDKRWYEAGGLKALHMIS